MFTVYLKWFKSHTTTPTPTWWIILCFGYHDGLSDTSYENDLLNLRGSRFPLTLKYRVPVSPNLSTYQGAQFPPMVTVPIV